MSDEGPATLAVVSDESKSARRVADEASAAAEEAVAEFRTLAGDWKLSGMLSAEEIRAQCAAADPGSRALMMAASPRMTKGWGGWGG